MIVNPTTQKWIDAFSKRPKATLLVHARQDHEAAVMIAETIYNVLRTSKDYVLLRVRLQKKNSIGIEEIRDMQKSLQLRANKDDKNLTRFVLIEHAECLTIDAQNALLKLIEELPYNTLLMFACSDEGKLLPTVLSRCFKIEVLPITESQAHVHGAENGYNTDRVRLAYLLSEGRVSLFMRLLEYPEENQATISFAKNFIASSVLQRQKLLKELQKLDNPEQHLHALLLTAKTGMRKAKTATDKKRWQQMTRLLLEVDNLLTKNVNTKLAMLYLSVHL